MRANLCVHCLRADVELTRDHLFPTCWLPNIPTGVNRVTVPSCARCNNEYSRHEQYVLRKLAFMLDRNQHSELQMNVIRSAFPPLARDERDRSFRQRALRKLLTDEPINPDEKPLPNFERRYQRDSILRSHRIRLLPIYRMVCKFVRGALFWKHGIYLERNYMIYQEYADEITQEIEQLFDEQPTAFISECADAEMRIFCDDSSTDGLLAVCSIRLWRQWKLYATVSFLGDPLEKGFGAEFSSTSDYVWTNLCLPYYDEETFEQDCLDYARRNPTPT
jgi:hypothetical protein